MNPEQAPVTPTCLPSRDELAKTLHDSLYEGEDWQSSTPVVRDLYLGYADATLALLTSRVPQWQPVEFAQIKPGMRVLFSDGVRLVAFIVKSNDGEKVRGTDHELELRGMRWWDAIYTDTTVDPRVQLEILRLECADATRDYITPHTAGGEPR